jgi:hypothetical protein
MVGGTHRSCCHEEEPHFFSQIAVAIRPGSFKPPTSLGDGRAAATLFQDSDHPVLVSTANGGFITCRTRGSSCIVRRL